MRPLTAADWPSVREIYELGIASGIATFETAAPEWADWDAGHLPFGRFVALREGWIAGWVALSPVSSRWVYRGVAEVSVYVDPAFQRRGVGRDLLQRAITDSEAHGIWTLNAGIFPENTASLALHARAGFRTVGIRRKIARRDGRWWDNLLMERRSLNDLMF